MQMIGLARLGRDAELRHTGSGDAVLQMAIAYNYGKKSDKLTQWVDASMWGERAEKLAPYLLKGALVCVTLSDVHIHAYDKKDGTQGTSIRARVSELEFAGGKTEERQAKPQGHKPAKPTATAQDDDIPW